MRGLLILLANDCELDDVWSSATYLERCVPRAPDVLPVSCPVSRVADALREPYDVTPFPVPVPSERPFVLPVDVSREGLRVFFRGAEPDCVAV